MKTYKNYVREFDFTDTIYNEFISDNEYIKYVISIAYEKQSNIAMNILQFKKIYEGKSFLLNKKTTLDLTPIIEDLIFRVEYKFNHTNQAYKPITELQLPIQTISNVEDLFGDIINTYVKVEFYNYNNELLNTYKIPFTIFNKELNIPYQNFLQSDVELYNNSILENHIPYIKTDKYFIDIPFVSYANATPYICTNNSDNLLLNNGKKGNYFISLSLNNIIYTLENSNTELVRTLIGGGDELVISGGTALTSGTVFKPIDAFGVNTDILANGTELFLGYNDKKINLGTFDVCPAEWYMSWIDCYGYHSVDLKQVEEVENTERLSLTNIYDDNAVLKIKNKKSFNIKSHRLTNEQFFAYNHIKEAKYVVLYNTKQDEQYICTINKNDYNTLKTNNIKYFEINVSSIMNNNY